MSKLHDENKDIRLISKVANVNYANKTIAAPKGTVIGNRRWGRIDYLVNHCGWFFAWTAKTPRKTNVDNEDKKLPRKRDAKKALKENSLTNKKRK